VTAGTPPFERLDFLYTPSANVAADMEHFVTAFGATVEFAIEAYGTRVAMVRLSEGPPAILFTDHLEGERAIMVYRVPDLDRAVEDLKARGFDPGPRFGIPHGPIHSFHAPGGHRVAIYELTRPEMAERFAGRRDF
jgi:hypothetical protein